MKDVRMIARGAMRALPAFVALAMGVSSAEAAESAARGKCTVARIAEWKTLPTQGQPIVDGTINGRKVGVLLDTGATRSVVVRSAADRLGLVRYGTRSSRMMGVGGETAVETVSIDEFAIGAEVRRNWRVLVAGEHDFGASIAVILGQDYLRHADVEFDLAHGVVRVFQSRNCDGHSLAYWTTGAVGTVELEAISDVAPAIYFNVEINGHPVRAQLDSGAFPSLLTAPKAAELGVTPKSPGVVAGGCSKGIGQKSIEFWLGTFESFRIGDEVVRDPGIRFADIWKFSTIAETGSHVPVKPGDRPDMLLGADFLRSHRVLVAHDQRRMFFTYSGGAVFPKLAPTACVEGPDRGTSTGAAPPSN
jgi:clan AA aspartic protease (TIGR02281 family)